MSDRIPAEHVQAASDYADALQDEGADEAEVRAAMRRYLVLQAAYERQSRYHTAIRE